MTADDFKNAAALRASEDVIALEEKGTSYSLGLGTGSTTSLWVAELGRLFAAGRLRHLTACVSTSVATTNQAQRLGLPIVELAQFSGRLTLSVDGADEISPELDLIKGAGGAMLREREVALRAERRVFIADASKLSKKLGVLARLPVEVDVAATESELAFLNSMSSKSAVRLGQDGQRFITDSGNSIIDCDFKPTGIDDLSATAAMLEARPHVKAHGLFLGLAHEVIVASAEGVKTFVSKK